MSNHRTRNSEQGTAPTEYYFCEAFLPYGLHHKTISPNRYRKRTRKSNTSGFKFHIETDPSRATSECTMRAHWETEQFTVCACCINAISMAMKCVCCAFNANLFVFALADVYRRCCSKRTAQWLHQCIVLHRAISKTEPTCKPVGSKIDLRRSLPNYGIECGPRLVDNAIAREKIKCSAVHFGQWQIVA